MTFLLLNSQMQRERNGRKPINRYSRKYSDDSIWKLSTFIDLHFEGLRFCLKKKSIDFSNRRKIISPTGNWTPVSRVTGGDTDHYTIEDFLLTGLWYNFIFPLILLLFLPFHLTTPTTSHYYYYALPMHICWWWIINWIIMLETKSEEKSPYRYQGLVKFSAVFGKIYWPHRST